MNLSWYLINCLTNRPLHLTVLTPRSPTLNLTRPPLQARQTTSYWFKTIHRLPNFIHLVHHPTLTNLRSIHRLLIHPIHRTISLKFGCYICFLFRLLLTVSSTTFLSSWSHRLSISCPSTKGSSYPIPKEPLQEFSSLFSTGQPYQMSRLTCCCSRSL